MTELMTPQEHTAVYQVMAESIVQEDEGLDERVQRGALHLDEHFPGWANKIDLEKFQITSATECVIGQLHGDYWDSTINKVAKIYPENHKFIGDDDSKLAIFAEQHGFISNKNSAYHSGEEEDSDYDKLQASWLKAIKARQT